MISYSFEKMHPADEAFFKFEESVYQSFVGGVKSGYSTQPFTERE